METTTLKLYTLDYKEAKTYLVVSLFVLGNILLPQLCHLIPNGGMTLLPIYFFTLIAAYKYGWQAGLLTAVLSPTINSLLFGMPTSEILPLILMKSVLLALAASFVAKKTQSVSISLLILVVLSYQVIGTLGEWFIIGDFYKALQDFRIGALGMLIQVFGGYFIIKYLIKD